MGKMMKFMQALREPTFEALEQAAKDRDITVQELLRSVILPDWLNRQNNGRYQRRINKVRKQPE